MRKGTALIFPHRTDETLEDVELEQCFNLALECRERVLAQLAVMAPGEFTSGKLAVILIHKPAIGR
jgi:predicted ATP-dependent Lon-type protease